MVFAYSSACAYCRRCLYGGFSGRARVQVDNTVYGTLFIIGYSAYLVLRIQGVNSNFYEVHSQIDTKCLKVELKLVIGLKLERFSELILLTVF